MSTSKSTVDKAENVLFSNIHMHVLVIVSFNEILGFSIFYLHKYTEGMEKIVVFQGDR